MKIASIKEKYSALSFPVKASLWYTVCNVINKAIALLATPIFTRIMTEEEYGTFAVFQSWYLADGDLYGMIVSVIKTMPFAPIIMAVVLLTMIAFYATSFDSIALTASCYSYHKLEDGEQPNKGIQLMWCVLLILLPIALLFAESSMNNLQSVSIVAAFPIGAVIVMITVSFMIDAKKYLNENFQ